MMTSKSMLGDPPPGFDQESLVDSSFLQLPRLRPVDEDVDEVCERIYKACCLGSELHSAYKDMSASIDWYENTGPFNWEDERLRASEGELWPATRESVDFPSLPVSSAPSPDYSVPPVGYDDVVEQVALSHLPLGHSSYDAAREERFTHFPAKVLFPSQRSVEQQTTTRLKQWSVPPSLPDRCTERDCGVPEQQEEPSRELSPNKETETTEGVSNTAALKDIIGNTINDSSQVIRKKLQSLVDYYHFSSNRGFGLIRVTNSFTIPDMNKSKDFCPKLHLSNESVLIEVYFPRNERFALFQAVDVLTETGIPLNTALDKLVVMEMDGGIDAAYIKSITPLPLVPYFPEIPFMPVRRIANHIDKAKLRSKDVDEREALRLCNRLLADKYRHLNMDIKWVEFQVDRKKLLIFAEFREYVTFSNYVKEVCFLVKNYLKKRHNTRYPLRIYIQRKLVQPEDADFKSYDIKIAPPCKPNQRRISRINKSTVAVTVSS